MYRLRQLTHFLEKAELLEKAVSGSSELTKTLSDYEQTVVRAIEQLEFEEEEERKKWADMRSNMTNVSYNPGIRFGHMGAVFGIVTTHKT